MADMQTGVPIITETPRRGRMMKAVASIVVALIVILGIGFAAYVYFNNSNNTGPVARVNGVEVSRDHYTNTIRTLVQSASAQGYDLNDAQVQSAIQVEALSALVNGEILLQHATDAGMSASDEEVQAQYDALVTQLGGQDALDAQLATNNLSDADLREDIRKQIVIQKFISDQIGNTPVTVTEDEITNFYNQLVQAGYQMPDISEVHDTLQQQLYAQKQQQLVAALVQSLRADANIEILI